MNLQQIESEALHLPGEARAELAQKLLDSLDAGAEPDRVSVQWLLEAGEEASREAIKKLLHKTRGSMKLGKTPEDIDAEVRIMRDGWERTWE
uniref:Addiction module component n=1 Tax=Candidatus Kentrum sp. TC TaxID=2126339 RepID=A0A450YLI3_9GAMM|nr:MAG: hypothetical protein BECKTC1821E_GA0114239_101842 [Candidatus Kentron sp. TC]